MRGAMRRVLVSVLAVGALAMSFARRGRADDWTPAWTTASLSQSRACLAAAAGANTVFFGGGYSASDVSSVVDVWDLSTGTWSTASPSSPSSLSLGRAWISATSAGGKVFFAGGSNGAISDAVDVYDTSAGSTGTWSAMTPLSQGGECMGATSAGSKVFFAGGINIGVLPATP